MKRIILFLQCTFIFFTAIAQPGDYNGPAKITIKSFWDGAAKLEKSISAGGSAMDADNLLMLQKRIDDTKRKDAAYNIVPMNEKVRLLSEGMADLKKKKDAAIDVKRDRMLTIHKVDSILRSLFLISAQVDNGALKTIKEVIASYKKRTAEVLAMDRTGNKSDLETYLKMLRGRVRVAENDINELERRCREQTVAENAEVNYYEILLKQAFWDAAQKIFPEETDFAKTYATATKAISELGSINDVHAIAAKSNEQKIKDSRLPATVLKDAALEKTFIDVFNSRYKDEFKGTAIKAVLLSSDWSIQRNEITGIVTGRVRRGAIAYKGSNGKCYMISNFFIHQEYVGSGFLGSKPAYVVHSGQEMLCENVK